MPIRPLSWWKGWDGDFVLPFYAPIARYLPSGENFIGSGPLGTLKVPTVRNGFDFRSIRLTESTSPSPRPILDTAASECAALMSIVYGATPVVIGLGSMVTFVPSICSTLTMLSPPRVSRAVLSSTNATALGSDLGFPVSTLPTGVSCLSLTVKTETVPSVRLAIRASAPFGETRTCVAPVPAVRFCVTFGGLLARSNTATRSSGEIPPFTAASALVAAVTMPQLSSLLIQIAPGGPTTLPGASNVALIRGG